MRIKIIGDNNCARATRHILRTAGFAVSEYLPAEAIIGTPHAGYAITIEVAEVPPSGDTPDPSAKLTGSQDSRRFSGDPTSMPGHAALDQPAITPGEASDDSDEDSEDASSPAYFGNGECDDVTVRGGDGGVRSDTNGVQADALGAVGNGGPMGAGGGIEEGGQTEVYATEGVGGARGQICFDSVDSELEAAVLRHVTQLAKQPVVVDRPGGRVRSERELRLVIPLARDARGELSMDEAAAVAVEFGVLRGLLDLVSPAAGGGQAGITRGAGRDDGRGSAGTIRSKKKWWGFGVVLMGLSMLSCSVTATAAPRVVATASTAAGAFGRDSARVRDCGAVVLVCGNAKSAQAEVEVAGRTAVRAAVVRVKAAFAAEPFPAQGQFATGGPEKITDGTNTLVVDPCKGQTRLFVSINQTGNTQLVSGTASKKIYICSVQVVVAAATGVALVEGTGSVCGTGTAGVSGFGGATAATGWNFAANGGIAYGNGEASVGAEGTAADNLCLFNSGSGQVSGGIGYVVQ